MSRTEILHQLKQLLVQDLELDLAIEQINDNDSLFEDGINIDSLGIVELINFIEQRFSLQLSEDDLVAENFSNLDAIAKLIEQKQKA